MSITIEYVQDFRKYREFITFVTKPGEAKDLLPFQFYRGDMLDCFVVERQGDIVTVYLSNNTGNLVDRFAEEVQPSTFESVPEGIPYIYDIVSHELIYNFDAREPSCTWNWSTYPETFWMTDADIFDHGLALSAANKPIRLYLSNERLISLFVGLGEINDHFPSVFTDKTQATIQPVGVNLALSIIAAQLGVDVPKLNDVKTVVACDMVEPSKDEYAKYNFASLIKLFELKGNEDDIWEDTWGTGVTDAIARDDEREQRLLAENNQTQGSTFGDLSMGLTQMCLSDLADLSEVPKSKGIVYVHMDIPIHGVTYMSIHPDQTLKIFFNDLIIKKEDILMHLENLPQEQLCFEGEYDGVDDGYVDGEPVNDELTDDELADLDRSGTVAIDTFAKKLGQVVDDTPINDLPSEYRADSDEELGKSGGRHQ